MVDFQSRDRKGGSADETDESESSDHDATDEPTHDHEHHAAHDHDHHAHDVSDLAVAIITVSSSRSLENDPAGDAIAELVEDAGHRIVDRELVGDDYDRVQGAVDNVVSREDVTVVITTGGTGVTPDDVTIEAVEPLFEKGLPGFGELFRRLSYDEIGAQVVATRTAAGVADGVPVFCLPGSENAVRLGVEKIILEVAGHLAGLVRRGE
jgi:molybdenum cofactor biosynthesis protein B